MTNCFYVLRMAVGNPGHVWKREEDLGFLDHAHSATIMIIIFSCSGSKGNW